MDPRSASHPGCSVVTAVCVVMLCTVDVSLHDTKPCRNLCGDFWRPDICRAPSWISGRLLLFSLDEFHLASIVVVVEIEPNEVPVIAVDNQARLCVIRPDAACRKI